MQPRNLLRVASPTCVHAHVRLHVIGTLAVCLLSIFSVYIPSSLAAPGDETTYYFLNDHLGSVDTVLDDKGNIVEQRDFLPFGSERVTDEEGVVTNTSHKFTGKELDDETGLYYYGARYYDPVIGRFISADPWGGDLSNPQTLNKYSYVTNNPLRYVDPTGAKVSEFQPYLPNDGTYEVDDLLGTYRGMKIKSSGHLLYKNESPNQCVELAQMIAKSHDGVTLGGNMDAYAYGDEDKLNANLKKNNPDDTGSYKVYDNGSTMMPKENDIITWSGGKVGHVGFIAEVTYDDIAGTGTVYTLEQNAKRGQALFSQTFTRGQNENGEFTYSIDKRKGLGYKVKAWARYDKDENFLTKLIEGTAPPNFTTQTPVVNEAKEQPSK